MTSGSLFSGIGGFDLGFQQAGIETLWQCEIDNKCQQTLATHFPHTEIYTDVRAINQPRTVDVITGGFPCQDLSVAGRRAGLAGERSGLWFEFRRVLAESKPRWCVIENVPGLLSSNKGRDFAIVLQGLAELGYGVCWRILDAQFFGVAQRRRRVFIVGSLGDWSCLEILFESESLCGNTPPVRTAGQAAPTLFASGAGTSRTASAGSESEFCIPVASFNWKRSPSRAMAIRENAVDTLDKSNADGVTIVGVIDSCGPINDDNAAQGNQLIVGQVDWRTANADDGKVSQTLKTDLAHQGGPIVSTYWDGGDVAQVMAPTLTAANDPSRSPQSQEITRQVEAVSASGFGVRRLTPTECERLQGFPDGWTAMHADTVRYRQLGNAVAVPVAKWIGTNIRRNHNTGA